MPLSCKYNELRDIKKVESGMAIDLTDALRTGVVPSSSSPLDQNGIDDPDNILGVVRDKFDAIDAQRLIKKYGKKAKVDSPVATPPLSPSQGD